MIHLCILVVRVLGYKFRTSGWILGAIRFSEKLALTSPKIGCRSVDIVHSRTQAMEFCSLTSSGLEPSIFWIVTQ
jgi:hypothetical protein